MEPLKELALFAYYWAPIFCADTKCTLYHKNWSLVRLLDGNSALPDHSDFFVEKVRENINQDNYKILISGAADTGLLAVLKKAIDGSYYNPDIALLDQCKTVINQNSLYAESADLKINFIHGNILSEKLDSFDLILAHSFLNFFDSESMDLLFSKWKACLKPGGIILLNNKSVDVDSQNQFRKINQETIETKLIQIKNKVQQLNLPDELVESLRDFWLNGAVRGLVTTDRLIELIKKHGFSVVSHKSITNSFGSGPTAVRLGENRRVTNLMVLKSDVA